ncbi:MAG TPA: alpha/beta hydrolase [Acidimicrobiales bacterium]|nr:alpha/beta hydrolase [Acidimicrobiales bacterium]
MSETAYHPQAQTIIDMINAGAAAQSDPAEMSVEASRAGYTGWWALNGPGPEISEVRDVAIAGEGHSIPARVYRPTENDDAPIIVFFHGGGMVVGSMNDYDGVCRLIADATDAVVVNVDYRLAPEHPYPAAADDAWAAVQWVAANAAEVGGSADRLIVAGDSAGGNLAALVALRARDNGGPAIALQMLLYPVTDWAGTFESMESNGTGNFLTKATMEWFRATYFGDANESVWTDPAASPYYADVAGVCPAWVMTTSHDPLRDEGEAYAAKLEAAGVATTAIRVDGVFHAFFGQTNLLELAVQALADFAAAVKGV